MSSLKISFNDEVRRYPISENGDLTFSSFIDISLRLYPSLRGKNFLIQWYDDEDDLVSLSSDAELKEAIRVLSQSPSSVLRFSLKLIDDAAPQPKINPNCGMHGKAEHIGVTCDECGMSPIMGVRYKCTVRPNFDLCEACEKSRLQPYPMIKMTTPGECFMPGFRGHPSHGPPGMRHPPGRGFHGRGRDFQPPQRPCPPHLWDNIERRAQQFGKKLEKMCNFNNVDKAKVVAPFIAAMDAFVDSQQSKTPAAAASVNQEPSDTSIPTLDAEEQLLQEAIEESIHFNETYKFPASASNVPDSKGEKSYIETTQPAVMQLPKPALRFVRDITFPDGTIVTPGQSFRKVWLIRNDGKFNWPEGVVLVNAGGDLMTSSSDCKEPLPSIAADQEAEISIPLTAPRAPGLYTCYFRAQTKEGQLFGHRLWANVLVQELEEDWDVIASAKANLPNQPALESNCTASPVYNEAKVSSIEAISSGASATKSASSEVNCEENISCAAVPTEVLASTTSSTAAPIAAVEQSFALLWRRELQILADMGFTDLKILKPLLLSHLGSPVSLTGGQPSSEAMERVVTSLLSAF